MYFKVHWQSYTLASFPQHFSRLLICFLLTFTATSYAQDSDGDGVVDTVDLDDDNDGIPDTMEQNYNLGFTGVTASNQGVNATGSAYFSGNGVNNTVSIAASNGAYVYGLGPVGHVLAESRKNSVNPNQRNGVITYTFDKPVYNLKLYIDGLVAARLGEFTLTTANGTVITNADFTVSPMDIGNYGGSGVNTGAFVKGIRNNGQRYLEDASGGGQAGGFVSFPGALNGLTTDGITALSFQFLRVDSGGSPYSVRTFLAANWDIDTDGDGTPDHLDVDADADGCFDVYEAGHAQYAQANGRLSGPFGANGLSNALENNDSAAAVLNYNIAQAGSTVDVRNNAVSAICVDTDGDLVYNFFDLDDDNDGILDTDEFCTDALTNIANTGTATQSSTLNGNGANRSIDGNTAGNYGLGQVSHTNREDNPWWLLEFPTDTPMAQITIWNRTDCCGGRLYDFVVEVLGAGNERLWSYHHVGNVGVNVTIPVYAKGRKVKVSLVGDRILQLAEVQVFSCNNDLDSDTTPNHLDVNMDGDNCFDALEVGPIQNVNANGTIAGPYGANGLSALVETDDTLTATTNYSFLQTSAGVNDFMNNAVQCTDTDNDGVFDRADVDDDNDGIPDQLECPFLDASNSVYGATTIIPSSFAIVSGPPNFTGGSNAIPNAPLDGRDLSETLDGNLSNSPDSYDNILGANNKITAVGYNVWNNDDVTIRYNYASPQNNVMGFRVWNDFGNFGDNHVTLYDVLVYDSANNLLVSFIDQRVRQGTNGVGAVDAFQDLKFPKPLNGVAYFHYVIKEVTTNRGDLQIRELALYASCDTDNDGTPDHLDLDADADGCPDAQEAGHAQTVQGNNTISGPFGSNGLANSVENNDTATANINYTQEESLPGLVNSKNSNANCLDADADGIYDNYDEDDDNDGILDATEFCVGSQTNVANTGTASQSSTFAGNTASIAIDGTTGGNYNLGQISHTLLEANPWWLLTLPAEVPVAQITIYNRTDCCTDRLDNFTLELLNNANQKVYTYQHSGGVVGSVSIPVYAKASKLRISLAGANRILQLAEVQVFSCNNDVDGDSAANHLDLDADGDGCNDVVEAGFTDPNQDGYLGDNPVVVATNGRVTSGTDGYTNPLDGNTNGTQDHLEAGSAPAISTQPQDVFVCPGCTTSLTVNASNADDLQWQRYNGSNWVDLTNTGVYSGANTATLTITNAANGQHGGQYRVVLTSLSFACDPEVISDAALLTFRVNTVITNRRVTHRVRRP